MCTYIQICIYIYIYTYIASGRRRACDLARRGSRSVAALALRRKGLKYASKCT